MRYTQVINPSILPKQLTSIVRHQKTRIPNSEATLIAQSLPGCCRIHCSSAVFRQVTRLDSCKTGHVPLLHSVDCLMVKSSIVLVDPQSLLYFTLSIGKDKKPFIYADIAFSPRVCHWDDDPQFISLPIWLIFYMGIFPLSISLLIGVGVSN